jgi:hypothetical protein
MYNVIRTFGFLWLRNKAREQIEYVFVELSNVWWKLEYEIPARREGLNHINGVNGVPIQAGHNFNRPYE